jgi:alkaline phosphatase D
VHYCAAHHYDPSRAAFTDFNPFWEFVAGPLNAGTFGPGTLDKTFGPEVKFVGIPPGMKGNRPPSDGFQFFGLLRASARTRALTVELRDVAGKTLYRNELPPTLTR